MLVLKSYDKIRVKIVQKLSVITCLWVTQDFYLDLLLYYILNEFYTNYFNSSDHFSVVLRYCCDTLVSFKGTIPCFACQALN